MEIEVCIDDPSHIKKVIDAGADRIELCNNLMAGGTTPSLGAVTIARKATDKPIHVLIRPRIGDFIYSNEEVNVMIKDIEMCKDHGIEGVVVGVLDAQRQINEYHLERICRAAEGLDITFHRAFDTISTPFEALQTLHLFPVNRILSSGGQDRAIHGLSQLRKMVEQAGSIQIMPGAGITVDNCIQIIAFTKAKAIHFSAYKKTNTSVYPLHQLFDQQSAVDQEKIRTIKSMLT